MEEVREAMRLMAELEAMRPISPEQEARILQKFRLDWNYHSNHIEGNSLTYGETKSLLLYGITAQGKPLKDHIEITGHNEALNWVLDIVKGGRPLTESFIRELHQLLLREPYEVDAITPDGKPTKRMIQIGQYKSMPNHVRTVTGETHFFASVEETPAMVHELMDWYRAQREEPETNPIFLAALFHHRFISIHPFDDGNGRTGRLLMNFVLMQYGYPPVIIKTDDKAQYYRALQQADGGNTDAFVQYIAVNLLRSLNIMLAGARGESIEEPDDLDKELALLEQRLKGVGKKAEVLKSKEAILGVLYHSVMPLFEALSESAKKFERFYLYAKPFWGGINPARKTNSQKSDPPFFSGDESKIYDNTETLFVLESFDDFRFREFGPFKYSRMLSFVFDKFGYSIMDSKEQLQLGSRLYNEPLTSNEIDLVVKTFAKDHMVLIEDKLNEIDRQA